MVEILIPLLASDTISLTYDKTKPDTVNLLRPQDGAATKVTSIVFDWTDSSDTLSGLRNFSIQIDSGMGITPGDGLVFEGDTTTSDTVLELTQEQNYIWRVLARDQAGNTSDYSSTNTFRIDQTAPPRVDDLASTADVDPPDTGVHLIWTFSSSDVEFFRIYRSFQTADTSTAVQIDTVSIQPDTVTYLDNSVTEGDSYFYYVTPVDTATNEGDSSNITAAPHITFKKTQDDTNSHRPGDTIVYTIQYVNDGFAPTGKFILEDAIPDSVTLSDTAEVVSGPTATIEYFNDNSMTWQSSSFPRTAIKRIRWIIDEEIDPQVVDYKGTLRFRSYIN